MRKKTQYGGDVVMFLLNKIIKNVGLAHGFKTINHVQVLNPCAHGFYAHGFNGFKTMHMVFMHMVYGFKTICKAF